jgi:hypothetical protein
VICDIAPGLWIWRLDHPDWDGQDDWDPAVTCTCVESRGEVVAIDPLGSEEAYARFDATPPTLVAILKPDHVRDVDAFVARYGVRAYGPMLFWPGDVPETELVPLDPGDELPGGLWALYDGRGRLETPLWLPEQRTIVFADALTAPRGELLVWGTPWHEQRTLPALRELLDLPFERVIVAHGEPVHDRDEFERALERPPYGELEGS